MQKYEKIIEKPRETPNYCSDARPDMPEGMRIFLEEAEICLIFVPATVISGMTRAVCPEIM